MAFPRMKERDEAVRASCTSWRPKLGWGQDGAATAFGRGGRTKDERPTGVVVLSWRLSERAEKQPMKQCEAF